MACPGDSVASPAAQGGEDEIAAWRVIVTIPEFPLPIAQTALLVIDLTVGQISRDGDRYERIAAAGRGSGAAYAYDRCRDVVVPNTQRLLAAFRERGAPVLFTTCASLRGDGSDQTWRHRMLGHVCRVDSPDAQVVPELARRPSEPLLVKTGSSAFNSTNLEHLLRNLGVTTLVVCGVWTNSCVEGAIRDAGDRDFRVVMAEDCCAAMSPRFHANAIEYLDANFCHVRSTDWILARLAQR